MLERTLEDYKQKLKRRTQLLGAAAGISSLAILLLQKVQGPQNSHAADFVHGFGAGLFVGLELVMVFCIAKIMAGLKDDTKLKKMYIAETDERQNAIRQQAFVTSGYASLFLIAFAALVAGYFNLTVSLTLIWALMGLLVVKIGCKLYYTKKLS